MEPSTEAKGTPPPCSQVSSEESGSVTVHALRAAAFDLSNQNLVQERMEHHIAKMDCKWRKHIGDEQAREARALQPRRTCFPHRLAH